MVGFGALSKLLFVSLSHVSKLFLDIWILQIGLKTLISFLIIAFLLNIRYHLDTFLNLSVKVLVLGLKLLIDYLQILNLEA